MVPAMTIKAVRQPLRLKSAIFAGFSVLCVLFPAPMLARAADCIAWSEARPIIAQQRLIGSEEASALAQSRFAGETLVNVKFCRTGERFVYFVFLLRPDNNKLRRVVVDASSGRL